MNKVNKPRELNPFDCKQYDKNKNKEINKCLNCTKKKCNGNCIIVEKIS